MWPRTQDLDVMWDVVVINAFTIQIDYIFDQAAQHQLKVIVALVNNWELVDGVPSYLTVSRTLNISWCCKPPHVLLYQVYSQFI